MIRSIKLISLYVQTPGGSGPKVAISSSYNSFAISGLSRSREINTFTENYTSKLAVIPEDILY